MDARGGVVVVRQKKRRLNCFGKLVNRSEIKYIFDEILINEKLKLKKKLN